MKAKCTMHTSLHSTDQLDYHGRCLGLCFECEDHLQATARYTTFCPSCDVCPDCGCPNADGFSHYAECKELKRMQLENVWQEYDSAAEWLAKQGLKGSIGDPLPALLSVECRELIGEDIEAFQDRVRMTAYALTMEKHNG